MKCFILRIVFFLLVLFALVGGLELYVRKIPNPYKYKNEWMEENARDVEILILGSSHAYRGIKPEYLDGKSFNLAMSAQRFKQDSYLLFKWGKKYEKLKVVISTISYFSFFLDDLDWRDQRYYKIYMDCGLYPSLPKYMFELSDAKTAFMKIASGNELQCDSLGWNRSLINRNIKRLEKGEDVTSVIKNHSMQDSTFLEKNLRDICSIAEFCRERDYELVLITTPCWKTYVEQMDVTQKTLMYQVINKISSKYDIRYLDYLSDSRFSIDDFYDCDHLSPKGAIKFTKILNEDLWKNDR